MGRSLLVHQQVSSLYSGSPATHTSIPELRGTFPEEVILKRVYEPIRKIYENECCELPPRERARPRSQKHLPFPPPPSSAISKLAERAVTFCPKPFLDVPASKE